MHLASAILTVVAFAETWERRHLAGELLVLAITGRMPGMRSLVMVVMRVFDDLAMGNSTSENGEQLLRVQYKVSL